MAGELKTRFAPSPSGYLHLGHVASAIYVWGVARALGAKVLLRIEDHDLGRTRPEYMDQILSDLSFLGFEWDGGYKQQMADKSRFEEKLAFLKEKKSVYSCCCSRKEILAKNKGLSKKELWYPGTCRDLMLSSKNLGLRFCMPKEKVFFNDLLLGPIEQHPYSQCGDMLLCDRHGYYTYQYAVVVDDADDGINLIIRGQDLLASTGRQVLLAKALKLPVIERFYHHPLILDDKGEKLAKKKFSTPIKKLREQGEKSATILGQAAYEVGLIEEQKKISVKDLREIVGVDG